MAARRLFVVASAHLGNPPEGVDCAVVRNGVGEYTLTTPHAIPTHEAIFVGWVEDPGAALAVIVMASRVDRTTWSIRMLRGGAATDDHGHVSILRVDDEGSDPLGH